MMNNSGGHPVLISKRVCKDILLENENEVNFKNFLKKYSVKEVDVDDNSIFLNINTNEELIEFIKEK